MTKRLDPDPDLEALIERLNRTAREPPPADPAAAAAAPARPEEPDRRWSLSAAAGDGREWLDRVLRQARARDASDLLLVAGIAPIARVHGKLLPLGGAALTAEATEMLCAALVPAARREAAQALGSTDFTVVLPGAGRFRCNVHRERGRWAAAVRLLPETAPELEDLHLPVDLARFAELEYGLVLLTGPTGSGKSTTLAALTRRILARGPIHVVTIEDPVEFTHAHGDSVVEHVEIGRDTPSFATALRAALRQDPDVLLVGEMRDAESIAISLTAAETGHLVLATLHTGDAPQTVHRILDSYPPQQVDTVRTQLSISLAGVVSQQLLPRADGQGRVPAVEILVATHAVRNLIREGKIARLRQQITLEASAGMLSLDASLAGLARSGLVEAGTARARARDRTEFDQHLRRPRSAK